MMEMINKKRNKKGFTLIELVVVIAILGILAAIAIPRLSGFQDTAKLKTGAANAKLLASTYHIIVADGQDAPTDVSGIISATNAADESYLADGTDITEENYNFNDGNVTFKERDADGKVLEP